MMKYKLVSIKEKTFEINGLFGQNRKVSIPSQITNIDSINHYYSKRVLHSNLVLGLATASMTPIASVLNLMNYNKTFLVGGIAVMLQISFVLAMLIKTSSFWNERNQIIQLIDSSKKQDDL